MRTLMLLLLTMIFLLPVNHTTVFANLNKQTVHDLKEQTDFKLLLPKKLSVKRSEIKEPYPLDLTKNIGKVRLHYFDRTGENLLIGITQHKATDYKEERIEITVHPNNQSETKIKFEEFKPNFEMGEEIFINGNEGRFVPWGQTWLPGGILWWIDHETYIEMDSSHLNKKQMIKIANSMK
jgi:6-pyruvoyl-tetrahydropterin synthase